MSRHGSMNRVYRLIWSYAQSAWVVVGELARGRGKSKLRKLIVPVLALSAETAMAGPAGGQVVGGAGVISQQGATTTINQSSQNLSLNWQSFNVGSNETVNFAQPSASAIAVNRIFDTNGSQILGHLNANGQVWLINPNGILFGQGAQVNVGGLVASTLDLQDATLNNDVRRFGGNANGSVINRGNITAANGGYVALLGNYVSNEGSIIAANGTVALGAGSAVTLTFSNNSLVAMQVDAGVLNSEASNGGVIHADGGVVVMTAGAKDELLASVVNNTGVIEARAVENRNGKIVLQGGNAAGTVNVAGTLDASAPGGGNGGFIETSAAHVQVVSTAKITTAASMGLAGTWLIDPVDFTIAASGGDITGTTLTSSLGSGNVVIQSADGASGTFGDVNVNDVVSWSANTLTLSAYNNININANLNASSSARLALEYGQGAVAANNTSNIITTGASVNLPAGTSNFTTKQGSDGGTKAYTVITSLGAAGSTTTTDLQGMSGDFAGNYALGADIDAAATAAWNNGAGFAAIGDIGTQFTGTFDGLGHTISDLTINRPTTDFVGLFGYSNSGATVRNVGMVDANITGQDRVAGLMAQNNGGSISNSYSSGTVSGRDEVGGLVGLAAFDAPVTRSHSSATVSGAQNAGGLIGQVVVNSGAITDSYATGTVTASLQNAGGLVGMIEGGAIITRSYASGSVSGPSYIGGLVGHSQYGDISESFASGTVSAASYGGGLVGLHEYGAISGSHATGNITVSGDNAGGLVGFSNGSSAIDDSYSSGSVTGGGYGIGGLVGTNVGTVSNSHSAVDVTGGNDVGGLIGRNQGTVTNSHAIGNVSGNNFVGGLAGSNGGTISDAYASTGTVEGTGLYTGGLVGRGDLGNLISNSYASTTVISTGTGVGGLVGYGYGVINNSYATGAVTGAGNVGGLAGISNYAAIDNSYASGLVTLVGGSNVGGLVGYDNSSTITHSYWDITSSGQASSAGGTGLTTAQMLNPANFSGFNFTTTPGATGNNWVMVDSDGTLNNAGATLPMLASEYSTKINNSHQLQLMAMALSGAYTLGQDIDVAATNGVGDVWGSAGFVPIGNNSTKFTGTFDGANHAISGLTINAPANSNVALIGSALNADISNVGLIGVDMNGDNGVAALVATSDGTSVVNNSYATGSVRGNSRVGGLVGGSYGTITNSYTDVDVTGNNNYVGGLVGRNYIAYGGSFSNNHATGAVSGSSYVGGLIGSNENNSTVSNSHATGNVTSTGDRSGGLVGQNDNSSTISNNYSTGNVTGTTNVGGLVGANDGVISNSHYDRHNVLINGVADTYLTAGALYTTQYQDWFSHSLTLNIADYSSTLVGSGNNYSVNTVQGIKDLLGFADNSAYTFTQTSNLDLSGQTNLHIPYLAANFDGGGHTVSNLSVAQSSGRLGLFGLVANGSTVSNVNLLNVTIDGIYDVGGLVGRNNGTVSNSTVAGSVSGSGYGVGGLVGFNNGTVSDGSSAANLAATGSGVGGLIGISQGTTTNSHATGSVSGNAQIGGLVGQNTNGTISNSYASTGTVTGTGSNVGGLVGWNNFGTISDSYATTTVSSTGYNVGGLVGWGYGGTINNAHATGSVSSNGGSNVGGLVGWSFFSDTINNSYATGPVSVIGGDSAGGLVGSSASGTVNNSYATGNVSGQLSTGGLIGSSSGASVNSSYATGAVGGAIQVGGLIGFADGSTISNSFASGAAVNSGGYTGGLVGYGRNTAVSDAYATGSVTGTDNVGGLVGYGLSGSLTRTYSAGAVTASGVGVGGLVGANDGAIAVTNSYWNTTTSGQVTSSAGTGLTTTQMQTAANFAGFNFTTTPGAAGNNWVMVDSDGTLHNAGAAAGAALPMLASEYSTTINNAHQLQLMAMDLIASYLLGSDINATTTGTSTDVWGSTGFVSVGNPNMQFIGTLDGANHTINGLTINAPTTTFVGLFAYLGQGSMVQNVGLAGGSTTGFYVAGGLAGLNLGTIANSYNTGSVEGTLYVGGLAGASAGLISNSHASGSVSGASYVGGLTGYNYGGTINDSYASGSVSGNLGVGGLTGANSGAVNNSYATASVSGAGYFGGLIGLNIGGTISNSHFDLHNVVVNSTTDTYLTLGGLYTGQYQDWFSHSLTLDIANYSASLPGSGNNYTVNSAQGLKDMLGFADNTAYTFTQTGNIDLFGETNLHIPYLAGTFNGAGHTISNLTLTQPLSHGGMFGEIATTGVVNNVGLVDASVNGSQYVGGLAGENRGSVSNSYVMGTVAGSEDTIGGLVGENNGTISNSYSAATVTSNTVNVGGLVGSNNGTIGNSFASGSVSGVSNLGGLAGTNAGTVSNSYWNSDISAVGFGGGTATGATGLTAAQMNQQSNFAGWDFSSVWIGYDGFTNPMLRSFMTALTVSANNDSKTYDGLSYSGGNGASYSTTPDGNLLGTLNYSGTSQGATNAGRYGITVAGLYSNQQGYIISYADGTLTVNKADLALSTANVIKTYDGTVAAAGVVAVTGGTLYGSDSLSGGGSLAFTDKNVGNGTKTVTITGVSVSDGNGGGNYNVTYVDNTTSTINPANLTVTGITAIDKTYDGTIAATLAGSATVSAFGSDTVAVSGVGTGQFGDASAGTGKAVTVSGFTLSGADAANYVILQPSGLSANIIEPIISVEPAPSSQVQIVAGQIVASVFFAPVNSPLDALTTSKISPTAEPSPDSGFEQSDASVFYIGMNNKDGNPLLQIVNGGMKLPDDMAKDNE